MNGISILMFSLLNMFLIPIFIHLQINNRLNIYTYSNLVVKYFNQRTN